MLFNEIEQEKASNYVFKEHVIRGRIFDIIHYVQKSIFPENSLPNRDENTLDELFFRQFSYLYVIAKLF